MRSILAQTMIDFADAGEDVYFLTGDIGSFGLKPFADKYPQRFYNCGVAEANMIGMAAGLALSGKTVYVYSIVPFAIMRCYEQLRVDVSMHNANVKIIGVGGCFDYSTLGPTHHGYEDISLMRNFPNMKIHVPCCKEEAQKLLNKSEKHKGPEYFRFSESKLPSYNGNQVIRSGNRRIIFTYGSLVKDIQELCKDEDIDATIINVSTIKPFHIHDYLFNEEYKEVYVFEEHFIQGGLGDIVASQLHDFSKKIFVNCGIEDYIKGYGSIEDMKRYAELDKRSILEILR